jgi:mannose-6-phosphate isomerase-like protein (cupin superfamily)
MKQALLLKPGESRGAGPVNIFGGIISTLLAGSDTDGGYAITDGITPPGGGPPLHRHSREDESFYILEGEFDFEVDGKLIHGGPGCSVFAPLGTVHQFQNVGTAPGRMLSVVQPAGLEEFFNELAAATAGMKEPARSVVLPIFEKYGLELLGPPMAVRRAQSNVAG